MDSNGGKTAKKGKTLEFRSFEIPPDRKDSIVLASGGVNPGLAESVADSLGIELANVELKRHANDELYVRYEESVRGKDVVIIQSHSSYGEYRIEEAVNEHLFLVNAAADSSAKSVTAIAPYLAHSRGDRKSKGREIVPAPLVVRSFENAGADTMMSIDVHSPQTTEHFRRGPYDHLTAQPELRAAVREYLGEAAADSVVVAPDAGSVKNNNRHAEELSKSTEADINVIFMGKERARDDSTVLKRDKVIHGVEGKICLTFDDMIDGGGTMISAAETLKNSGAREVYVAATHPIFSGNATEKLQDSVIDRVFVTDTLPVDEAKKTMDSRLEVVRVGPLIGRAIYENMTGGSISKLFDDQNAI